MKTLFALLLGVCLASTGCSQVTSSSVVITQEATDLEKLVAPIALYPDSLVALILPAATTPSDVVLAARFMAEGGTESQTDSQPWSESVKSLVHYPALLKWMDDNLAWTQEMGQQFAETPAEVMNAIQHLRAKARADGILAETPEQRVVVAGDTIYILPARSDLIYIPSYDPEIFWVRRPAHGYLTFSVGFTIGSWLYYDCDWGHRSIWVHHRNPYWVYRPGWRPHIHPSEGSYWVSAPRPHPPSEPRPRHMHGVPHTTRFIVPTPGDRDHAGRHEERDGRANHVAVMQPRTDRTTTRTPPPDVRDRETPGRPHRPSDRTPDARNPRHQQPKAPETSTPPSTTEPTRREYQGRQDTGQRGGYPASTSSPTTHGRYGEPQRADTPRTPAPRPTRAEPPQSAPPPRSESRPAPPPPTRTEVKPAPTPQPAPAQEASSQEQVELRARGAVRRR